MYRDKKIALVIPAYNEEKLIKPTLENIPKIIDMVYVVDDVSPDNQAEVIKKCQEKDKRIILIRHKKNTGPGGAIISGYKRAYKDLADIVTVVGGDFQMPLHEVERLLDPIIENRCDYSKGNRFLPSQAKDTLEKMPKTRLFGNWIITLLTKISSGYYKIMDVVDGFTAISRTAISVIDWDKAWKGYGYPMDFLVRMNAYGFKTVDIPRTAIYLKGERQSQIKGFKYALKVSPMLIKDFFWRINFRYIYRDFHPLAMFFYLSFIILLLGAGISGYLLFDKIFLGGAGVTASRSVLASLLDISGIQFLLFAMLFDMQEGI